MATAKQRRDAERRRLRRQARRRQYLADRRRRLNVIVTVVGVLAVLGLVIGLLVATSGSGSSSPASSSTSTSSSPSPAPTTTAPPSSSTSPTPTPTPTPSPVTTKSCVYRVAGTPARAAALPPETASTVGTATIRVTSTQGALTLTLTRAAAPCAVNSFVSLARQKYFDETSCHRLVTASIFVLQCGDPLGTGAGTPGYQFDVEPSTNPVFPRGSVVMANGGPTATGSQFFLVDRDTRLGVGYSLLGRITTGLSVLDRVARAGTSDGTSDGPPKLAVTLQRVTVA